MRPIVHFYRAPARPPDAGWWLYCKDALIQWAGHTAAVHCNLQWGDSVLNYTWPRGFTIEAAGMNLAWHLSRGLWLGGVLLEDRNAMSILPRWGATRRRFDAAGVVGAALAGWPESVHERRRAPWYCVTITQALLGRPVSAMSPSRFMEELQRDGGRLLGGGLGSNQESAGDTPQVDRGSADL